MDVKIIKSRRRTLSISVTKEGEVVVKAPLFLSDRAIKKFVAEKEDWIENALEKAAARRAEEAKITKFTDAELKKLKKEAGKMLLPLIAEYAEIIGVTYGTVSIRAQKSRWGSCSGKGNLNFNCLLALCPEGVMRYVTVHELCHRKYMNHSRDFWNEVSLYMPDYKEHRKWLKDNGEELIRRL